MPASPATKSGYEHQPTGSPAGSSAGEALLCPAPTPIPAQAANEAQRSADEAQQSTDEALMHALQSGDDAPLAALMQRWEIPVKSFLSRLGVPRADIDDVAQEAFVRLYNTRRSYRSSAPFKPWLLTIAANLGRNRLRWRLRRREDHLDFLTAESMGTLATTAGVTATAQAGYAHGLASAAQEANPREQAEQRQRFAQIRATVNTLPAKLRQVLVCVDLEELSHAEAAQVIGCTAKAVETRLRRAREQLRLRCGKLLAG